MTRCGSCGRPLSSPRSVAMGYGPYCAKKKGMVGEKMTRYRQTQDEGEEHRFIGDKPRVFISFHYEDDQGPIELLRHQAKNSEDLEFTDYSAKEPWESEEWKRKCEERISRSSVLIVAIGEKTHSRPAVLWEIRKAYELGKPVFGMRIYGTKSHKIPEPLLENGSPVIAWELSALQAELDKLRARKPAYA